MNNEEKVMMTLCDTCVAHLGEGVIHIDAEVAERFCAECSAKFVKAILNELISLGQELEH